MLSESIVMHMFLKSKFPFFRKNNFCYLDNSATTQVPEAVIRVVKDSLSLKGNPHRGAHRLATKNADLIEVARANIARFINCKASELVFTSNTTDSINLAVDALYQEIQKGDEIIVSVAEHNSNLLPFDKLLKKGAILKTIAVKNGLIDVEELEQALSSRTRIVSLHHCSNVLGNVNPVVEIAKIIKGFDSQIIFMLDGAQAIAHVPVDLKKINCDFYAFSGHKMYGPDGIGGLFVAERVWPMLSMVRMGGGTISDLSIVADQGKDSLVIEKPNSLAGLEGGTPNVANILGLSEAVSFMRSLTIQKIREHELDLTAYLIENLNKIEGMQLFGPKELAHKIGVVSFNIEGIDIQKLEARFNKKNICIRSGSHCAFALINELGTETVRVSVACYTDRADLDQFLQELNYFINKERGLIINPALDQFKDFVYYKRVLPVNTHHQILTELFAAINNPGKAEVVIMAGHFLAIPDKQSNSFYPSIKSLLPKHLHSLLDEFGMTSFPIVTWELGCEMVRILKSRGIRARLMIIANDTTGFNELKESAVNTSQKNMVEYRMEFLKRFGNQTICKPYLEILTENKLSLDDVMQFEEGQYYTRESTLRGRFKKFITENKDFFDGIINYTTNHLGNIDLNLNLLDNQAIKTCRFDTFNSKTGGKFCIVELVQLMGELFGKSQEVHYNYVPTPISNPKCTAHEKVFVALTPAMCSNAVNQVGELYNKLYLQEKGAGSFKFFNVPFGPNAKQFLASGTDMTYISDKDNLLEIVVEKEPGFAELWGLISYHLLYNIDDYLDDILDLFQKIKVDKSSKILDTCVGGGFLTTELIEKGFDVTAADISSENSQVFINKLAKKGLQAKVLESSWLDLTKHFKPESFDILFNRGNVIIYANGGWNQRTEINRENSIKMLQKTFEIYYELLKPGGYLYVDKYKDTEVPAKKVVAKLKIQETKKKKDVVFYVEKRPAEHYRYAAALLRNKDGKEEGLPNMAYDLSEEEMEAVLKEVGFSYKKLKLKSERHFVSWLAQK